MFLRERERAHASDGGAERVPTGPHPVSAELDVGLEPVNREIMTWASQTLNRLSRSGTPGFF